MARLTTLLAAVLLLGLAGCSSSGVRLGEYDGKDAGFLVASMSEHTGTYYSDYTLHFRNRKDQSYAGRLRWAPSLLEARKAEFVDGTRSGIVEVVRLPPGDYELYNFEISSLSRRYKAKQDFAYPFTIKPGAGTCIGEFLAVGIKGPGGQSGGAFFVVSNMAARGLPLAKGKEPALPPVVTAVADVRSLGTPLLQAGAR
jgi:hypothetical protein